MNEDLKKYVRNELKNRVSPRALRYNLINAGWPEEDVDDALRAAKSGNSKGILVLGMIIGVVTISVALLIALTSPGEPPSIPPPPNNGNNITTQPPPNLEGVDECKGIIDSIEKHYCYLDLAVDGIDCKALNDTVEKGFCYRALESYFISLMNSA